MTSQAIRTSQVAAQAETAFAPEYDRVILLIYLTLICIGLVMVASASIGIAEEQTRDPF